MKIKSTIAAVAISALALPGVAFAAGQNSDSETVKIETEVVTPMTVGSTQSMRFGDIVTGATAGTVVLGTDASRSVTGGVTLASGTTTPRVGIVNITGAGTSTFNVTFSTGTKLTKSDDATKVMTVDTYVLKVGTGSDQTSNYSGSLVAGAAALNIGATLNVGDSTANPAGSYATDHPSGVPLTVTVAYN